MSTTSYSSSVRSAGLRGSVSLLPRISVVIPAYNSRDCVGRALRSALEQTCPPFEIIVVDDGSGDRTGDLIREEFGDRVRYHYQRNRGPSAARNAGIRLSSGDWVAFLDSDDYWAREYLEFQVEKILARPEVGMVGSGLQFDLPNGLKTAPYIPSSTLTRKKIQRRLKLGNLFPTCGVVIRRDVFIHVGGYDERWACGEDRELYARVAASYEISVVSKALAVRTKRFDSLSSDPQRIFSHGFQVNRAVLQSLGYRSWRSSWLNRLSLLHADALTFRSVAFAHLERQERRSALACLVRALLRWPFLPLGHYKLTALLLGELALGRRNSPHTAARPEL